MVRNWIGTDKARTFILNHVFYLNHRLYKGIYKSDAFLAEDAVSHWTFWTNI